MKDARVDDTRVNGAEVNATNTAGAGLDIAGSWMEQESKMKAHEKEFSSEKFKYHGGDKQESNGNDGIMHQYTSILVSL